MIGAHLAEEEARAAACRASRPHVAMVGVLDRLFRDGAASNLPVARVAEAYNGSVAAALPIKSVGHIIRTRLGLETRKSAGVYVIPAHERMKVARLAERYRPGALSCDDAAGFSPARKRGLK